MLVKIKEIVVLLTKKKSILIIFFSEFWTKNN